MTTLVNADTGDETALPDGAGMLLFDDTKHIRVLEYLDSLSNALLGKPFRVIGLLVVKEEMKDGNDER